MKLSAVILALLAVGCASQPKRPPVFSFPEELAADCARAVADARARIESCGTKLKVVGSYYVFLRSCSDRIDGLYYWTDAIGRNVAGLTTGQRNGRCVTEIAVGPDGRADYGCLVHEAGHYWLISNFGDSTHNPAYDEVMHWGNQTGGGQ